MLKKYWSMYRQAANSRPNVTNFLNVQNVQNLQSLDV